MTKGVGEFGMVRSVTLTKARIVRRDDSIAVGEKRHQIAEHMRRRREPMQQNDYWAVFWTGFAVEDVHTIDRCDPVVTVTGACWVMAAWSSVDDAAKDMWVKLTAASIRLMIRRFMGVLRV